MIKFQLNDGGRKDAGYKGTAGDCVVRAFAIHTDSEYKEVYRIFADAMKKATGKKSARNGILKKVYTKVFAEYGLTKYAQPTVKMTFSTAAKVYPNCIVSTTKHLTVIKGGVLHDISDCRTYVWGDETRERKAMTVWV